MTSASHPLYGIACKHAPELAATTCKLTPEIAVAFESFERVKHRFVEKNSIQKGQ